MLLDVVHSFLVCHHCEVIAVALEDLVMDAESSSCCGTAIVDLGKMTMVLHLVQIQLFCKTLVPLL